MSPSTSTRGGCPAPTFASLGVRGIINCRGTYTTLTGSRVLDVVAEAMRAASDQYVAMDELMARVGERLATLTGAEFGYVSCGCAAALTEVTAAAVAGTDPERMQRLPDATGMPNEVIIQAAHRNAYDRAIRLAGARMVEVVTRADLEAAFTARSALVAIIGDQAHLGEIAVGETIAAAHAHGVPALVDAAAERPDVPNRYLAMGADAVAYSGGKCLRGPQASGLVLGRRDLLWAAYMHAAPHHGVARPMKAGKEEIMGLLAAVEAWVHGRDHAAEWRAWEGYLDRIRSAVADLPTLSTEMEQPGVANVTPMLRLQWDTAALGVTPEDAHRALWEGEPRIALHLLPDGLRVNPYMMEEGDDTLAASRLREVLTAGAAAHAENPEPDLAAAADLNGGWVVDVRFVLGAARHAVSLAQNGAALSGTYRAQYGAAPVEGSVRGRGVAFCTEIAFEGNCTPYRFTGRLGEDGTLAGDLDCGEYGCATWTAHREG